MKKIKLLMGMILVMLLSACQGFSINIPGVTQPTATPTQQAGPENELTPTPDVEATSVATVEPVTSLTLWIPPEMDPESGTEAGQVLGERLQLFSSLNGGLEVIVRFKDVSGSGGLLDALTATSEAAPDALPDLIALPRTDLESAALKGLIYPLDGLTELPDDADWFNFTHEMALLQGSAFGLPFAADAIVLTYRSASMDEIPATWTDLMSGEISLAFPVDSNDALLTLALYQAQGGLIQDNQRRPVLEAEPLTTVFELYRTGAETEVLPSWLDQIQTLGQAWSAYREGQTNMAITWVSNFLKELPADTTLAPLLPMAAGTVSLGTGMSWALATPNEARQELAVELAEFLVDPQFLATWTSAAGYLPTRPSALDGWEDAALASVLGQIGTTSRLVPSNDIITSLGPLLKEGTRQVLQGLMLPNQAAQTAVESLED
ncbi:MAG: extracellular solute-binding protein [Anaerolineaceae bacterium]|nr:extracellular solute-binding protein [Anaerolineaceae bacterium]